MASHPDVPAVEAANLFVDASTSASYGSGRDVELLGGSVTLKSRSATELAHVLPPVMVIKHQGDSATDLNWLMKRLDSEWAANLTGSQVVCNDILRIMFVHALRVHIATADPFSLGWLGGLREPRIAAALSAIHADPAKSWKLAELASIAGMSRSTFAERFKSYVGQTPIGYVARWRMQVAAARLLTTADSVSSIADSVGFLSDAAFGATFRRLYGVPPGQYRIGRGHEATTSPDTAGNNHVLNKN